MKTLSVFLIEKMQCEDQNPKVTETHKNLKENFVTVHGYFVFSVDVFQ
jgi:hypothetical protein